MREINKQDIDFLKSLQYEMLTQDTVGQASPRFWVIMQEEKDYWVEDSCDGMFIYDCYSGDTLFEGELYSEEFKKWFVDFINNETGNMINNIENFIDISFEYDEEEFYISNIKDLKEFLNVKCGIDVSIGYYRIYDDIKKDTMFLTYREAKEHIRKNHYHYRQPHPYAMTAWRSPQVEKLYEILENVDFDKLNKE